MAEHDEHSSPQNPDNRIERERLAADRAHESDVATHGNTEVPARKVKKVKTRAGQRVVEVTSTGHSWDGIEEYDNPLPKWWLYTFYVTIIWAIGYTIMYPAWPLFSGNTQGITGETARKAVAQDIARVEAQNAPIQTKIVETPIDTIPNEPELMAFATKLGASVFGNRCAQCHQQGGGGAKGYPALLDNDWLWGGTLDDIYLTVEHGIRDPHDPETRYSEMPKFGTDGLLDKTQIGQVVNYVLSLSGQPHDSAKAKEGAEVFAENCVACHGEDGKGDRAQGAPNLTDAIWLYGNKPEDLTRIITEGPFGVMPAWSGKLTEAQIKSVALYVHSLGGGE